MVPLEPYGPVGSEAVFNARADHPPTSGVGSARGYATRYVGQRCAVAHPAAAGLAIEQPVVCRPAEACRERLDPSDFCTRRDGAREDHRRDIRLDIRSIEHPFDAENEYGRNLPVIADLTASDKSRPGVVEGHVEQFIGYCGPLPRASHIGADIESGPIIIKRHWRYNGHCATMPLPRMASRMTANACTPTGSSGVT